MAEHRIAILNRVAIADAGIELVCNNPTDSIRFEFDEEWAGIAAKTARFSWEGKHIDVPFSGNVVTVPEIFQTNYVFIGVFADNIASTPAKVKSRYSIKCLGGKVVAPSADVYSEIIALINAGVDANDGVGVSSAIVDDAGHLIITLTTGKSIDCGLVKGKDGAGAKEFEEIDSRISSLENYEQRPFEAKGDLVQIDNYEGMPMDCVTRIEPVQDGSGDPSPDNIRPISGRTSAKLTRCGKNLCGGANDVIVQNNPSAATVTYADNVFTLFTADGYADGFIFGHGAMKQGRKYTISGKAAGYVNLRTYNKTDMNTILVNIAPAADGAFSLTFAAPTDDVVFRVWVNSSTTCTLTDFQIEEGDRTEYEPYQGETFTADFGQTVYGGTIDWGKGLLTVDGCFVEYTGAEGWKYHESGFVYLNMNNPAIHDNECVISSHYPTGMGKGVAIVSTGTIFNQVRFYDTGFSNAADWKAYLAAQYAAGAPVQIAYTLAEPTTIQLTPQQITALQGVNYIWSDAGETTVRGRKDVLWLTHSLIERVAELEAVVASLASNAVE